MTTRPAVAADAWSLSEEEVSAYRRDGFIKIEGAISADDAAGYAKAASELAATQPSNLDSRIQDARVFTQLVDAWRSDDVLARLTLAPRLGAMAEQLAGCPLRVWHDHLLIKQPHNERATEFHQDAPYWPHAGARHSLSAWVALVDVPVKRGCMTFIPGSQSLTGLRAQDLENPDDLLNLSPELQWSPRVTLPLRAGDCTFHSGLTVHGATPNFTDDPRIAHVVIWIDADTSYTGASHVVTDPLGMTLGDTFPDERFPRVST